MLPDVAGPRADRPVSVYGRLCVIGPGSRRPVQPPVRDIAVVRRTAGTARLTSAVDESDVVNATLLYTELHSVPVVKATTAGVRPGDCMAAACAPQTASIGNVGLTASPVTVSCHRLRIGLSHVIRHPSTVLCQLPSTNCHPFTLQLSSASCHPPLSSVHQSTVNCPVLGIAPACSLIKLIHKLATIIWYFLPQMALTSPG